jgi:hypothetical protein
MQFGFQTWKDVLEVIGIPIAIALAGLLWPSIQLGVRRGAFMRLIFRELSEVAPYPADFERGATWVHHQQRDFVHKRIFDEPSENRDFILSLPADIVYHVSQLWQARARGDADQWLYSLGELSKYDRKEAIAQARVKWIEMIAIYKKVATDEYGPL